MKRMKDDYFLIHQLKIIETEKELLSLKDYKNKYLIKGKIVKDKIFCIFDFMGYMADKYKIYFEGYNDTLSEDYVLFLVRKCQSGRVKRMVL